MKVKELAALISQLPQEADLWLQQENRDGDWTELCREVEIKVVTKTTSASMEKLGDCIVSIHGGW